MVISYDAKKERFDDETEFQFIHRMCETREVNGFTWIKLAQFLNEYLQLNYSETWYRRNYHNRVFCNAPVVKAAETFNETIECIKNHDEFSQLRSYLKRISREETILEIAQSYAEAMKGRFPLLEEKQLIEQTDKEGILLISDWHYGRICDNPWNKFDPDICRQRVAMLLSNTIAMIEKEKLQKLTVLNLSDLIAGRIHAQLRYESRFEVITQIMDVCDILEQFLRALAKHCRVDYYDCLDNHSRLEPNKKESLDLESLTRIIPWYLKKAFVDSSNIQIKENEYGHDIITCNVLGHRVIGVHGHEDKPDTVLERLTLLTREHFALVCTAHLHHFSLLEQNQSLIVSNSSLMGVDSYSKKLRLTSDPSQTLIIVTKTDPSSCIYRLMLK